MSMRDSFSALVGQVYEAALVREGWPNLIDHINSYFGGTVGGVFVHDQRRGGALLEVTRGIDDAAQRAFNEHYSKVNPLMQRAMPVLASGQVFPGQAFVADDEFVRSEYYNGFLKPAGVKHTFGACLFRESTLVSMLSVVKPADAPPFSNEELQPARLLVPHLQRAIALARRLNHLELERTAGWQALDLVSFGVVVLDSRGRPLFVNQAADDILTANDGLRLGTQGLEVEQRSEAETLRRLIAESAATATSLGVAPGGGLRVSRRSGHRPYSLLVAPLRLPRLPFCAEPPAVIVFLADPESRDDPPEAMLSRLYRLTPAEARLAGLVVQGHTPAEASELLGVSIATVRTQLASIFAKTETSRQSELVRLLLQVPVRHAMSQRAAGL
jgi:DNA-binding CsgD family transcriptional regulator